jgi:ATP synthase F1 epsilon subunit
MNSKKLIFNLINMLFSLISTTKKILDKVEIESAIIPTINGEIQVLPHHQAVMGVTQPGILKVQYIGREVPYALGAGIYEVDESGVRVIADMVDSGENIDIEQISKKKEEAKKLMKHAEEQGLISSAEYLAAEEEILKQTALEQLAKRG